MPNCHLQMEAISFFLSFCSPDEPFRLFFSLFFAKYEFSREGIVLKVTVFASVRGWVGVGFQGLTNLFIYILSDDLFSRTAPLPPVGLDLKGWVT